MKSFKVFQGSKRLKDIYPHATKWQVFKFKTARFLRKLFLISAIAVVAFFVAKTWYPDTTYAVQEKLVMVDTLGKKVEELKSDLLSDLSACESGGHKESDGIIIFDSNNEASIGQYQFQIKTVQHYYKVIYNQTITRKEAVLIALDEAKAKSLAHDIIFKGDSKGLGNWVNCTKKKSLNTQLAIIKKLEK